MKASESTPDDVRALCAEMFDGKLKFAELKPEQQWALVCAVWPDTPGPQGYSMAPF
jgi:hypothetical protein